MAVTNAASHSVIVKLVAACTFWGGTFIAGRYLAQQMPVFTAATIRFLFALLGLMIYMRYSGATRPRLTLAQLIATFALGATGIFIYNAGFFSGLALIPASRAALIVAASPIMTLCAVQLIERAAWSLTQVLGVCVSFTGAVLVVSHGDPLSIAHGAVGLGELFVFGGVVGWVVYTLVIRYRLRDVPALTMTFHATVWGTLLLAIPASFEFLAGRVSWPSGGQWAALAYLGLCGTSLSFVWYGQAVAAMGAARATQFTNLVPVFGVLFSVLLLGESLAFVSVLGGALVVVGVMLANRRTHRQKALRSG